MNLVMQGVVKRYGRRRVLDGADFEPAPGKATVLLGRNGTGKTTLLKLALGLLKPDAGTIRAGGVDPIRESARVLYDAAYVPDKPDVDPWITPAELFRFLEPHYPRWSRERAARLAADFAIPLDRPFRKLSRGEGMKALLAAALAPDPSLILLDEPFGGLDPIARDEVLVGVLATLNDGARTIVCATHDLEVAIRVADRVAVLQDGRIVRHEEFEAFAPDLDGRSMAESLKRSLVPEGAAS